jgi:hypothetical protein
MENNLNKNNKSFKSQDYNDNLILLKNTHPVQILKSN